MPWLHHPLTPTAPSILHLHGLQKCHGSIIRWRLRLLLPSSITMALSKCYGAIISRRPRLLPSPITMALMHIVAQSSVGDCGFSLHCYGFNEMPWLHHPLVSAALSIANRHGFEKCHDSIIRWLDLFRARNRLLRTGVCFVLWCGSERQNTNGARISLAAAREILTLHYSGAGCF